VKGTRRSMFQVRTSFWRSLDCGLTNVMLQQNTLACLGGPALPQCMSTQTLMGHLRMLQARSLLSTPRTVST
jgi:hypothetical protein